MRAVGQECVSADNRQFTWNHRVKATLFASKDGVSVDYLRSMRPGHKQGSLFMDWLTAVADQHGVTLSLVPTAQDEDLKKWYGRFDFVSDENSMKMIRLPRHSLIERSEEFSLS